MIKSQLINLLYSILLFLLGSVGHWYIMYWQFKLPKWVKTPWPYLISIVCTFLWIMASHYGVKAFNGEMWPSRLFGFSIGAIVFTILSWLVFSEPLTTKTYVCLFLALLILLIQLFWK